MIDETNVSRGRQSLVDLLRRSARYSVDDGMMVVSVVCRSCMSNYDESLVTAIDNMISGKVNACISCDPEAE